MVSGPSSAAAASHPPAARTTTAAYTRSASRASPIRAPKYGERGCGQVGDGEQPWPLAGVAVVEPPAGREDRACRGGGRDLGAVPPREPGKDHRGGDGEPAVDDDDGLQSGAASAAGLPADLPVGAHARRLVLAGAPVESSSSRR